MREPKSRDNKWSDRISYLSRRTVAGPPLFHGVRSREAPTEKDTNPRCPASSPYLKVNTALLPEIVIPVIVQAVVDRMR